MIGVAALYYAIVQYSIETDWFSTHTDPPAITDLGRKSKLSANIYIASITMMSTLIPFVSYFAKQTYMMNCIAAIGAASLQAAVVFEGDAYGQIHSNLLLFAGLVLGLWLFHLHLSDSMLAFICSMFLFLYLIRQSKKLRTLFVLGEYALVLIFVIAIS